MKRPGYTPHQLAYMEAWEQAGRDRAALIKAAEAQYQATLAHIAEEFRDAEAAANGRVLTLVSGEGAR